MTFYARRSWLSSLSVQCQHHTMGKKFPFLFRVRIFFSFLDMYFLKKILSDSSNNIYQQFDVCFVIGHGYREYFFLNRTKYTSFCPLCRSSRGLDGFFSTCEIGENEFIWAQLESGWASLSQPAVCLSDDIFGQNGKSSAKISKRERRYIYRVGLIRHKIQ